MVDFPTLLSIFAIRRLIDFVAVDIAPIQVWILTANSRCILPSYFPLPFRSHRLKTMSFCARGSLVFIVYGMELFVNDKIHEVGIPTL
jgi:hypothetical protein